MAYAKGLIPVNSAANLATFQTVTMEVAADYGTAIFVGDPVIQVAAGMLARTATNIGPKSYASAVGDGHYPLANVATATDANVMFGVVTGIQAQYSNLENKHIPASTGGIIHVCRPTIETLFVVGEDADTDPLDLADIGAAVDFIAGAGSATTGYSGWIIDSDSHATAEHVILRGIYNEPGNIDNIGTTDMKWLVGFQSLQFAANPVGVGI
jgi:hypothetical protein